MILILRIIKIKIKTGFSGCKNESYKRLKVEDNTIFLGYDFWAGLGLFNIKQNYMEWARTSWLLYGLAQERLLCGLGLGLVLLNMNWAGFSGCKNESYKRLKVEDNTIFLGYDFWAGLALFNIKQNYMEWARTSWLLYGLAQERLLCGLGLGLVLLNMNWARFSGCKNESYKRLKVEDNTIFLGYDFWAGLALFNIKQNYMEWARTSWLLYGLAQERLLCGLGLGLALLNMNWAGLGWALPY